MGVLKLFCCIVQKSGYSLKCRRFEYLFYYAVLVDFGCLVSSCHGKRLYEGSEACFSKLRLPASKVGLN